MTYTVTIVPDFPQPTVQLATNEEYVNFVMNMAAQSYMNQYGTATPEDGITAARNALNATLPPAPTPEPVQEPAPEPTPEPVQEAAPEPVQESEPVVAEPSAT